MLACHTTTDAIMSFPKCLKFRIIAQPRDAVTAPAPNANSNHPNPAELLFSHCWIMFYLIGTGKAIREAVEEYDLEPEMVEKTKAYKSDSYPWLMLAMGMIIATFVLGGGAYSGAIGSWMHHALFYLTVGVQVWTLLIEGRVLLSNERLMTEINRRAASITAA